jgi:hypothetical protein
LSLVFLFCAPRLIFGGTEGVGSHFHVLRSRNRFSWFRGRRILFSCFKLPDSFSAVPSATCPVFIFCAPALVFDGTEGVGSRFHVLRAQTHFRQYRVRRVHFSCCALGLFFGGTEGVGPRFYILRSRSRFRRFRGRRDLFLCFALPYTFSKLLRATGPVFDGIETVGSRFHVLRSQTRFGGSGSGGSLFHVLRSRTRFQWYRGRQLPFSCFTLPASFSGASGPVFLFRAPGFFFDDNEGVRS